MSSRIKSLLYQLLLMLVLFQFIRVLFICFNHAVFNHLDISTYLVYMLRGIQYDLAALFMVNAPLIVLSLLPFHFCHSKLYQYFLMLLYVVVNTVALIANFVDVFYYQYTLKRLTFSIFDYLGTQANMSSLGLEFFITYWYAFAIISLILFGLIRYFLFTMRKLKSMASVAANYRSTGAIGLVAIYILFAGCKGNLNAFGQSLTLKDAIHSVSKPEEVGIVMNSVFSLIASYMEQEAAPEYFDQEELDTILPPVHHYYTDGEFQPNNVVIIILESFTSEALQSLNQDLDKGQYPGYAPFLDSLMQESLYYPQASANGRKSIDALPSILASIPAYQTPFILTNESNKKVESLASHLNRKGYQSLFFHGSHNASMGFARFCESADVTHYYGLDEYPNQQDFDGTWGIWDEPYLQYMAQELNKCDKPFFATAFTLSSHNPFVIPDQYQNQFPKGTQGIHETMHYADHALRQFFHTAKTMPWYHNTLFVVTADHAITPWHKEYATSDKAFAVPLLFFAPGHPHLKGARQDRAQHIDIYPTVLNYLDYNEPFISAGNNLLEPRDPKFTVNLINQCYQMTQGDYLLLFDGRMSLALYNLKKDRYHQNNLITQQPKQAMDMERLLKGWIQQFYQNTQQKYTS